MVASSSAHWLKRSRADARQTLRRLNDIFVLTSLSIRGLALVRDDLSATKRRAMDVVVLDHAGAEKETTRRKKHLRRLLSYAIERTQVEYALQSVVAETESYLGKVLRQVLTAHPSKLGSAEKKIELSLLLESSSKEEALSRLIEARVAAILYGSPSDYIAAVTETLSAQIPTELSAPFSEVKATRDLAVHANGIVNQVYLRKASGYSRAERGAVVPIDQAYLRHSVAVARRLVSFVSRTLQDKFGEIPGFES